MENYIALAVILLIVGCAIWYIVKSKKNGQKCIGCPYGGSCGKKGTECNCNKNDI